MVIMFITPAVLALIADTMAIFSTRVHGNRFIVTRLAKQGNLD